MVLVKKEPSFIAASGLFIGIIAILIIGISVLKTDLHVLLVAGLFLTALVSKAIGFEWQEIQAAMTQGMSRALVAMIIFIMIGMLIGSWIHAGTVSAVIFYGLKMIDPAVFLPAGFVLCSLISLATGTSWGTAGTMGVALMGIGGGLGVPAPMTAGMVVSGAFFGDKMSPLSDTTNLAAASSESNLYEHITAMMYTTIPAFIISLVVYTFLGFQFSDGTLDNQNVMAIQDTLNAEFNLNPLVILPMVVVLVLSILRVPAIPAMFSGVVLGVLTALIFQGATLSEALTAINYGYSSDTGLPLVDKLLTRGGIQNMMWTFSLAFIALCLGGILDEMGFLKVLVAKITQLVHKVGHLITVTIFSGIIANVTMGEAYLSIIIIGRLYRKAYEEKNLQNRMLSRVIEEGATMSTAMIPWTTAGAFMAGTLGVSTFAYAPYAVLNWINPLISIVLGYCGIFVLYRGKRD
jgi:NhaC family Na+:H+ antiporter